MPTAIRLDEIFKILLFIQITSNNYSYYKKYHIMSRIIILILLSFGVKMLKKYKC